jgi:LysR family transcriptional regulator, carnitine catabolism transcriptional activator
MDERRLRVFLAVIDEGGVTRAARKLRTAQPSVSQTLRALERECGVELFHRVGRGLRPTPAGEALVGPARQAVRSLEAVAEAVAGVATLAAGRLDIGALSTLASDPLSQLIGRFRKAHQGVSVRVLESEGVAALATLVRSGECELGVTHLPSPVHDLRTHPLGRQELLLVFPPGLHASTAAFPVRELASTPLVVPPTGTSTRMLLEQALADAGVEPRVAVETAAREATIPLVLDGAGAALLPATLADDARRRGATVRAPDPPITREIGLVHRDERLSPAAHAFLAESLGRRRAAPT